MKTEDIPKRLAYWQQALRIQDWDIEVKAVRFHELREGNMGECGTNVNCRQATISILDPGDFTPTMSELAKDTEATLVHELLHVVFSGVSEETENRVAFEQAIDSTARALVGLDRA